MGTRKREGESTAAGGAPQVDALVNELKGNAEGPARTFTLSRKKAREKIKQHLLNVPERYVLLLVRAMVKRGASRLEWRIDHRLVELHSDGTPFSEADFEAMYEPVGGSEGEGSAPGRFELALALLSCLKLTPKSVEVLSGDGTYGTELSLRPNGEEVLRPSPKAFTGTRIRVRFPLRWYAFDGYIWQERQEIPLVAQRCRYSPVEILVNGVDVATGLGAGDGAVGVLHFGATEKSEAATACDVGVRGEVGFVPLTAKKAESRLIKDGVWVDTRRLRGIGKIESGQCVAVLEVQGLQLDLSGEQVVSDGTLTAAQSTARLRGKRAQERHDLPRLLEKQQEALRRRTTEALETLETGHGFRKKLAIVFIFAWLGMFAAPVALLPRGMIPLWMLFAVMPALAAATMGGVVLMLHLQQVPTKKRYARDFPAQGPLRPFAHKILEERKSTGQTWEDLHDMFAKE